MRKTVLFGLGATLLSASALAQQAQIAPGEPHPGDHMRGHMRGGFFEHLDANKDGKVTRAEVEAAKARRFAEIDTNKDGALSKDELAAHHAKMQQEHMQRMAEMFDRRDTNKDGKLSAAEFEGPMPGIDRMFERFDTNKDGAISRDEMQKAHAAWREKRKG